MLKKEIPEENSSGIILLSVMIAHLDGTCNLAAAEASCTNVYMTRSTVNDCLYTLYVGFPCTVAASVGMAHFYTESNALITKFTLSHLLHLLV